MYSVARIMKELPDNYEEECTKQKAVRRWRGVKSPADLMLLIIIHLLNGTSLLETSIIARMAKLGEMSDVAFMNRLAGCTEWFKAICGALLQKGEESYQQPEWLAGRTVAAVDASDVVEKGSTRRTYRLHYALNIFKMASFQCKITEQSTGETLLNFTFAPGMIVIADRIYSTVKGMTHCINAGADFVLRMRKNSFKTCGADGEKLDLLSAFEKLQDSEYADITAFAVNKEGVRVPVRILAKRKTPKQIERTVKQLILRKRKCGVTDDAKIFNE
jgi:hypothetical protein